jgi:hypothetical protein
MSKRAPDMASLFDGVFAKSFANMIASAPSSKGSTLLQAIGKHGAEKPLRSLLANVRSGAGAGQGEVEGAGEAAGATGERLQDALAAALVKLQAVRAGEEAAGSSTFELALPNMTALTRGKPGELAARTAKARSGIEGLARLLQEGVAAWQGQAQARMAQMVDQVLNKVGKVAGK